MVRCNQCCRRSAEADPPWCVARVHVERTGTDAFLIQDYVAGQFQHERLETFGVAEIINAIPPILKRIRMLFRRRSSIWSLILPGSAVPIHLSGNLRQFAGKSSEV